MKVFFVLFLLLFCAIAPAAFCELSDVDLDKIQRIVTDAVQKVDIKIEALEKNMNKQFESVDTRFDDINRRISDARNLIYALIALIIFAISIPAWRNRKDDRDLKNQIESLTQEIETLKKQRIV